jgi:hypothetical protein
MLPVVPFVSWGGGYDPADDGFKFKSATTLNRRFVLLPHSWSSQLGHGPLLLTVFFRWAKYKKVQHCQSVAMRKCDGVTAWQ